MPSIPAQTTLTPASSPPPASSVAIPAPATFAAFLREHAAARPNAPALTCDGETWSFAELDARSSQTAQALLASGVEAGDRVGVLARNGAVFFEVILACSKINAVVVGLNWRLSPLELDAIVADASPALVFVGESEAELLSETARATPGLRRVVRFGAPFEAWREAARPIDPQEDGGPDDLAMILYTSGTTGRPKGVMLTNRGLAHTRTLADAWGMGPDSVNLVAMPLFHIGGCGYGSSTLLAGGHTVLMRDVNLPLAVELVARHRVTHTFLVPTVVQGLLDVPGVENADLSSLQLLMYGASPIGDALLRRALAVLRCDVMQAYGMTETSGTVVVLPPEDHRPDGPHPERLRSCGRALPFVELRITDPATFKECAPGAVGEIWVRSAMVTPGYWRNPEATAEAITPDGWLRTGDAAHRDADGYITLFDRFKDMIISGGENIYPAEIENVLTAHPAVKEAAVIGVPHERWGETPRAIVVRRPGRDCEAPELLAFVRERLARYKCPSSVVFADALPRNASGKVLKRELRRHYRDDASTTVKA